jgi:hypothetical protein
VADHRRNNDRPGQHDGRVHLYEREAISEWLRPRRHLTEDRRHKLESKALIPNYLVCSMIRAFNEAGAALVPQCGSASAPPSGLACNCITITSPCNCVTTPCNCIGILERLCTCQPRVYFLNTVCNPKFVGTCGSSSYPSSGLSCQCSEVSIGPKKACTCQP